MARDPNRMIVDFIGALEVRRDGHLARAEQERTPGPTPEVWPFGTGTRYALRGGTRCVTAPGEVPAPLRILCRVPDRPIPLPPLPSGLDTPGLVVFVDRVRDNIERLQRDLDARGIALRPHVKTHKSVRIARMQLEAGASGLTVGTLGEAEVLASAGLRDLFLAYPLWADGPKAGRLRAVHESADLAVGVDSADAAERLAAAVDGTRRPFRVLIEVDSGGHRTGVASPGEAVEVARAAAAAGLVVEGVFTHGGHSYRPAAAGAAGLDEVASLEAAAAPGRGGVRGAHGERRLDADPHAGRRGPRDGDPRRNIRAGRSAAGRAGGDRRRRDRVGRRRDGGLDRSRARGARRGRQGADQGPAGLRRRVRRDPGLARRGDRAPVRLPRRRVAGGGRGAAPRSGRSSRSSRTTSARWSTWCPRSWPCSRTAGSSTGPSTRAAAAADRDPA